MKEYTQDTFWPRGNCWQFAVACLLEVDPHTLPSQYNCYRQADGDNGRWSLWYNNVLQAYLKKHHGMGYVELHQPDEVLVQLRAVGYHLINGRTARSDAQDGCRHIVVAKDGETVWDPHPSRGGVLHDGTGDLRWAFLVPWPKLWTANYPDPCICPACLPQIG